MKILTSRQLRRTSTAAIALMGALGVLMCADACRNAVIFAYAKHASTQVNIQAAGHRSEQPLYRAAVF